VTHVLQRHGLDRIVETCHFVTFSCAATFGEVTGRSMRRWLREVSRSRLQTGSATMIEVIVVAFCIAVVAAIAVRSHKHSLMTHQPVPAQPGDADD
jgi:hypothetical protein